MENRISDVAMQDFASLHDGEQIPGITFDKEGNPAGCYTVEEVLDEIDRQAIEQFGETHRETVNARRKRWNEDGLWHFRML
ncbi:MAG: hypothetical protein LBC47_03445 [Tannerella sp.]|jgi:hypothetical protein|nr:hypothetical protein [Tannerella sp.]